MPSIFIPYINVQKLNRKLPFDLCIIAGVEMFTFNMVHTKVIVVFKQNVYAVDIERSTKIYFPPRAFHVCGASYCNSPHTRSCISINCVTCYIQV